MKPVKLIYRRRLRDTGCYTTHVYLGRVHIASLIEYPDKSVRIDTVYGRDLKDCRNMEIAKRRLTWSVQHWIRSMGI